MAEATTTINVTPKQLGKHLRSIRRKKGLSLSEVARGAGLSRRELVAYERGKLPIPESDLWVLAGSCGVDVAELVPSTPSLELTAAATATSVGDSVSQLRRGQEEAGVTAYLHTLHKLQALPAGKRIPVKDRELEQIATALGSTPRSIEQKLQEVLNVSPDEAERLRAMILQPPNTKGRPRALAAGPTATAAAAAAAAATLALEPAPVAPVTPIAAVPTPVVESAPADMPVFPVFTEPVQTLPVAPAAFLDQPVDAPIDDVHGHNIDVFAELARLPEPVPLGDPSAPLPDVLAPQDPFADPFAGVPAIGPPEGAVELVDTTMPAGAVGAGAVGAAAWNAADAPPIDVAMRQGSSTWDIGEPPLVAKTAGTSEPAAWETGPWQPPVPEGTDGTTTSFWEGTDDWTPPGEPTTDESPADLSTTNGVTELVDPVVDVPPGEPMVIGEDTWAGAAWDPQPWSAPEAAVDSAVDVNPWAADQWPSEPADLGAWDHRPDPAAVDSGFFVDWGTDDPETPPGWDSVVDETTTPGTEEVDAPAAWDTWSQTETIDVDTTLETTDLDTTDLDTTDLEANELETSALFDPEVVEAPPAWDTWVPAVDATFDATELVDAGTVEVAFFAPDDQPAADGDAPDDTAPEDTAPEVISAEIAHISWRADDSHDAGTIDGTVELAPTSDTIAASDIVANADWIIDNDDTDADVPEPAAQPVDDDFVVAGPDWQLGNALPLVEVRGQGGLVMRRADERWALADVTTGADFVAEVEVDFRSGPGVGVLFRASMDDEGRMSGYSFDIDPIYDGGGYLVRQWQSDRELWNPIARVDGDDPAKMYGTLLVRIEVVGEHLAVQVNGAEVLTVENLKQASADRGRDGASGDRVGVQAWSSSDLVIDTVRVASR